MQRTVRGLVAFGVMWVVGWGVPAWAQQRLVVDDDRQQCPNAQFTSINEAVQAAPPGAHIHVCPGLYLETVLVDRSLRIDGAGPSPALRTGDPLTEAVVQTSDRGFNVTGSDVDVSGFTVLGNGATTLGIDVQPFGTGNSVRRNYVSGHVIGIELSVGGPDRRPSLISGNRVEHCAFGISIDDNLGPAPDVTPAQLTVRDNTLALNTEGMSLKRMRDVQVWRNTLTDFTTGVRVFESTQVTLLQNVLETGGPSDVGIALVDDEGDSVIGNEIRGRESGPAIAGISLEGSTGDLIATNRVARMSGDGVLLQSADANTVMLNRSDDNGADGIELRGSSDNRLFANSMHGNDVVDAADDNRSGNDWEHNRCETDLPPGTICTAGP